MKKILVSISVLILLFSVFVSAELDKERCIKENIDLEVCKYQKSGGGSFYIAKDKTILGLTSKYDGLGWGTTLGSIDSNGRTLFMNGAYSLVFVNFKSDVSQKNALFHFKRLTNNSFSNFESYEILEMPNNGQTIDMNMRFRFPKEQQETEYNFYLNDVLIMSDLVSFSDKYDFYEITINKGGLVSIEKGEKKEVVEVEVEMPPLEENRDTTTPTEKVTVVVTQPEEKKGFWDWLKSLF